MTTLKPFASDWSETTRAKVLSAAKHATDVGLNAEQCSSSNQISTLKQAWLSKLGAYIESLPVNAGVAQNSLPDWEIASDLILVSLGFLPPPKAKDASLQPTYSAVDRVLLLRTLEHLQLPPTLDIVEDSVARQLAEVAKSDQGGTLSKMSTASSSAVKNAGEKSTWTKWAATGAGFGIGAVALGVTGGLAAPLLVASSAGLLSFLGGSSAIVLGSLFGLAGGGLTASRVRKRVEGVSSFEFEQLSIEGQDLPALTVTIVCAGVTVDDNGYIDVFRAAFEDQPTLQEIYVVKCDPAEYATLGRSIQSWTRDFIVKQGIVQVIKQTSLAAIMSAVALPKMIYSSATSLFDGSWVQRLEKSKKAGELLADTLLEKAQGDRPVKLIGVSLGAVTIFYALLSLADRSPDAARLIYSATLLGLPIAPSETKWKKASSVVSTPVINGHSSNDWILAILARASIHGSMNIAKAPAGIERVEVAGVKNVDLSDIISGHMDYATPEAVKKCLATLSV